MRQHHYIALLMVIIVLAVFGRLCSYEFLNYDDDENVYENPDVRHFALSSIIHFWKEPYKRLYIPLTYTLWAFQAKLAEIFPADTANTTLNPLVFHTTNLMIHSLSMLVLFLILRILTRNDLAACAGALLFSLHPVQVEPVAWISGFKDILSGFLSLLAVWQYISYANLSSASRTGGKRLERNRKSKGANDRRKHYHYIVATISFLLAMMAKPSAVVVPLVAGMLSYWMLRRSFRQILVELIPWMGLALPVIIRTKLAQPDVLINFVPGFWQRILVAGDALTFYLYKLVLPTSLGPDYGRLPKFVLARGWVYLTGLTPYLLAIVLVWKVRRPWLLASAGVFLVGLLPVSGMVPFTFQNFSTVADRYLYLSMVGPALGMAWLLSHHRGLLTKIICVLILGMLGLCSTYQARFWKDSYTFFKHALLVNPKSCLAHVNMGVTLRKQGKLEEAISHCGEAIRLRPSHAGTRNNLGVLLHVQGKPLEGIAHCTEALRLNPNYAKAYNSLAIMYYFQKEYKKAWEHAGLAEKYGNPVHPERLEALRRAMPDPRK